MNKRKGISLIILVITILVMIILAGVVVVSLQKNNPIEKAKEATFKQSLAQIGEELEMFCVNEKAQNSEFNKETLYANKNSLAFNTKIEASGKNIYDIIPSLKNSKYKNQIEVIQGGLYYRTPDKKEIPWLRELGIHYTGIVTGTVIIEGDTLVGVSPDYTNTGTLVIPNTVKKIKQGAFANCKDIVGVVLPEGITEIPDNCFNSCTSLYNVTIPNTVQRIGNYAFYACTSLTNLELPRELTTIGKKAFYWCSSINKLICNDKLKTIGEECFSYCGIKEIKLNEGLETIGVRGFEGLNALNVSIPNSVTTIGDYAFFAAKSYNIHIGEKAKCGNGVLRKTYELKELTVDQNNPYHSAKDCALYDKNKTIIYAAPYGAREFVMPDSVTVIADNAFQQADMLKVLSLSNNLQKIGKSAFEKCVNLTKMEIPEKVTSIGIRAFECCTSLANLTVSPNNNNFKIIGGAVATKDGTTIISCPDSITKIDIPNTVTTIKDSAFAGNKKLTEVIIPESVTTMEKEVFRESGLVSCNVPGSINIIQWGVFKDCPNLKTVTFNEGTATLSGCQFMRSNNVEKITIPASVTTVSGDFLSGATGLKQLIISPNSKSFSAVNNMLLSKDKTILISGGSANKIVNIPDTVTRIGSHAFTTVTEITEVRGGKNVREIGKYAFLSCTNLKKLFLSNSITTIDSLAFMDTPNLAEIYIPKPKDSVQGAPWSASQGEKAIIWQ